MPDSKDLQITITIKDIESRSYERIRDILDDEFEAVRREVLGELRDAKGIHNTQGGVGRKTEASPELN
jgi:hypothetical protein